MYEKVGGYEHIMQRVNWETLGLMYCGGVLPRSEAQLAWLIASIHAVAYHMILCWLCV